jgi:hypothetical protein
MAKLKTIRLSKHVNEPLNYKINLFKTQVAHSRIFYGAKIMKIRAVENLTLGHI